MSKIKTIVWDWNGTILADVEICLTTINTLLTRHNYPLISDIDAYKSKFCFPIIEYYRNVGIDFDRTPFDDMANEFMDIYHTLSVSCPLQPHSCETLEALQKSGLEQILLSASLQQHLEMQVARYPLKNYFNQLLGIQDIFAKSKLQLAKDFVSSYKYQPDEILFIGDSVHDFEVASSCGCGCVLYSQGHQNRAILERTGAPVIDDLSLLPGLAASFRTN